jgi:hypothetical protein
MANIIGHHLFGDDLWMDRDKHFLRIKAYISIIADTLKVVYDLYFQDSG